MQWMISAESGERRAMNDQRIHSRLSDIQLLLKDTSRDYIKPNPVDYGKDNEFFITYDKENQVMVQVRVYADGSIEGNAVGTVSGTGLEFITPLREDEKVEYGEYKDKNGKTIFDNFEAKDPINQDLKDIDRDKKLSQYHLEKYILQ